MPGPAALPAVSVVCPDPADHALLTEILVEKDVRAAPYATVAHAVAHMPANPPGVLLVDLAAPDSRSFDLVSHRAAGGASLPAAILLADADAGVLEAVQRGWGAVAVLAKPVEASVLLGVVRAVLDDPERAAALEDILAAAIAQGFSPATLRCPRCRWLLYLGHPDYRNGIVSGTRRGQTVACPGCRHALRLPQA